LAECCLEHDPDGKRELLEIRQARFLQGIEPIKDIFLIPNFYDVTCIEIIVHGVSFGV
jgi:hypothetical protein